jgi:MFS-type transporter involved in bile tolerance (Atg22 family)
MFVLNLALREMQALFSSVVAISCTLVFAMVLHQFAGDPLLMASIISVIILLYVACLSVERHWH